MPIEGRIGILVGNYKGFEVRIDPYLLYAYGENGYLATYNRNDDKLSLKNLRRRLDKLKIEMNDPNSIYQ